MERPDNDQILNLIFAGHLDEEFWYDELEIQFPKNSRKSESGVNHYDFHFGKHVWEQYRPKMYLLICDPLTRTPKPVYEEIISGDVRNAALGILSVLTSKFDVTLGVAIPLVALVMKAGIGKFCEARPERSLLIPFAEKKIRKKLKRKNK